MIELKQIHVTFDHEGRTIKAVEDVSLKIEAGEIYGIVGYSGAGKSTLVRTINLLQRPNQGQVIVNQQSLLDLSSRQLRQARKKIGMIFQHFNLMESRTIADNVAFPLKGSKLTNKQKAEKVASLLALVGLEDKMAAYPSQLSGGQKQRVAIARALANDPDILLCDEATSALDPKTTQSILDLLRELNQTLGLTIVMITHEMAVVKDLCHRVAVMEQGRILEEGSIVDIFTQPKNQLTKEFIDTATHFDREIKVVLDKMRDVSGKGPLKLARLTYQGQDTTQPIIAQLVADYQVIISILYGNVEVLQGVPVGNLLVSIEASEENLQRALTSLEGRQVAIELIDPEEEVAHG
ncbi:methionine ABC transporter ATP-binding protein [Facklamia languida]